MSPTAASLKEVGRHFNGIRKRQTLHMYCCLRHTNDD